MKDYYKINEISKLYNIGVDSLRYYEKLGILKPVRDENDYRLYSLKDIHKLNAIRDLRKLNFSMKQIKQFLDDLSVDNTVSVLGDEIDYIDDEIKNLKAAKKLLTARKKHIEESLGAKTDEFVIKEFDERPVLELSMKIEKDEEADFALKKLHRMHEDILKDLSDQDIGAVPDTRDIISAEREGRCCNYRAVVLFLEKGAERCDYILPKGKYLTVIYKGDYWKTPVNVVKMKKFAEENGFQLEDSVIELCYIDNRHTIKSEEFLTELEIKIKE